MATEQITIAELDINTDALLKSATETKKAMDALKEENKQLKKSTEDTTEAQIKNEAAIKNLNTKYNQQKKVLAAVTDENNKLEASQKALDTAINKTIKTETQATANNVKLLALRKDINTTTEKGRKQIILINDKIDKNNKLLKDNASENGKAKLGIGGYTEGIKEAFGEMGLFGGILGTVSTFQEKFNGLISRSGKEFKGASSEISGSSGKLDKFKIAMSLAAGAVAASVAILTGLTKAYASSARGVEDLARASDRLDSISKRLGNSLADSAGEAGLFDRALRAIQQNLLGVVSTINSDLEVAIRSQIRSFGILEQDQERQKKSQLDRAEVLRQIRDDDRLSIDDRIEANKNLATVIDTREARTIAFQEKRLKSFQSLLALDKGNIQVQEDIKRIEFEIADAREEAQGFRSEQLINEISLAREVGANALLIAQTRIEGEIALTEEGTKARLDLEMNLIDITRELQIEAAGENKQLREIAILEAQNAEIELIDTFNQTKLENQKAFEAQKKELDNQVALDNELDLEEKAVLKQEQDFEKQQAELEQLEIDQTQKDQLESLMLTVQETKLQAIRDGFTEREIQAEIVVDKKKDKLRKDELKREQILQKQKLSILSNTFGQTQELLGKNSAAGKAAGIAQATVNTFQGITEVWKTPSILPEPFATAAKVISTGTVLASGLGAVRSIKGVDNAFYEGGQVQVPTGTGGVISGSNIPTQQGGDDILASVDGTSSLVTIGSKEMILNPAQQARAGGSAFFRSIGVPGLNTGGLPSAALGQATTQAAQVNMDELVTAIADKFNAVKIVAIESDISNAQALQVEIVDGANI